MDVVCEKKVTQFYLTTMDDLMDDLIEEILIRLPTKYCFRCRGVSHRWRALVSSSYFACRFLSHPPPITSNSDPLWPFILFKGETVEPVAELHPKHFDRFKFLPNSLKFYLHQNKSITVLSFCNEFFLCCDPDVCNDTTFKYYIGNPHSERWVVLPPLELAWKKNRHLAGFICNENRFVVVRLTVIPGQITGWKLSSEKGRWTYFTMPYSDEIWTNMDFSSLLDQNRSFIAHNEKLYLLASKGVLEYDPFSDSWDFFGYTFDVDDSKDLYHLRSCKGVLKLSQLNMGSDSFLRIWELKKGYNKRAWSLEQSVSISKRVQSKSGAIGWEEVLFFVPSDFVILDTSSTIALIILEKEAVASLKKDESEISVGSLSTCFP